MPTLITRLAEYRVFEALGEACGVVVADADANEAAFRFRRDWEDFAGEEAEILEAIARRDAGKAVLLVSVELDEIFALSDRIIVLCGGRVTGERLPEDTNPQDLGLLMAGVNERAA